MEDIMENGHNNTSDNMELIDLSILLDDMWRGLKRFFWIFLLLISFCSSFFYFRAKRAYVPYYQAYSSFVVNTRTAYGYNESYYKQTPITMTYCNGCLFVYLSKIYLTNIHQHF